MGCPCIVSQALVAGGEWRCGILGEAVRKALFSGLCQVHCGFSTVAVVMTGNCRIYTCPSLEYALPP